jgi:phenylacetate-CoA ligase
VVVAPAQPIDVRRLRQTVVMTGNIRDARRPRRVIAGFSDFFAAPPRSGVDADDGGRDALALFQDAAATVPAYQRFLREHGVDPAGVRSPTDLSRVPLVTKENYLRRHPLADLCRHGSLDGCDMVAVSSGSSGEPTVWPRSVLDELRVAARFEQVFWESFRADERRTLAVVCFALGTWVGGMYTAACCRHLAAKGYPITTVTPGNNVDEILRVVATMAPEFEQTVLLGYPPFLKGVIDAGVARGVDWAAHRIKLVTAGEVFSEEWRDLVATRAGLGDPRFDSASLYGTADAGVLGNETPLSVAIRRFLAVNPDPARALFGEARLPTLVQYDPRTRWFERHEGTLVVTGDGAVPLVRYHIADSGGLLGWDGMWEVLRWHGFDPRPELGAVSDRGAPALPFVYVFGRTLFAVSYFGANVFPETVAVGLEQPAIAGWVTGKFVLSVAEDADRDTHLSVAVELAPGASAGAERERAAAGSILAALRRLNSEYAHYVPAERQLPRVDLRPAGDPEFFPPGVKHRYTRP